jgi:hypothetical protein
MKKLRSAHRAETGTKPEKDLSFAVLHTVEFFTYDAVEIESRRDHQRIGRIFEQKMSKFEELVDDSDNIIQLEIFSRQKDGGRAWRSAAIGRLRRQSRTGPAWRILRPIRMAFFMTNWRIFW